jgi:hypothetical protein
VFGTIVGLILILVVAGILTFNMLRRTATMTATPAIPPAAVTETAPPLHTMTLTSTPIPDAILPQSTATLTPWPTNTIRP